MTNLPVTKTQRKAKRNVRAVGQGRYSFAAEGCGATLHHCLRMPLTLCDINHPFLAFCWKILNPLERSRIFSTSELHLQRPCETRPNKPKVEETCQFKKQSRSSRP